MKNGAFPNNLIIALHIDSYENKEFTEFIQNEIHDNSFILVICPDEKESIDPSSPPGRMLKGCSVNKSISRKNIIDLISEDAQEKQGVINEMLYKIRALTPETIITIT